VISGAEYRKGRKRGHVSTHDLVHAVDRRGDIHPVVVLKVEQRRYAPRKCHAGLNVTLALVVSGTATLVPIVVLGAALIFATNISAVPPPYVV